ncbi:AAA family ATPase, partial [Geosmithia morbida]
MVNKSIDVKVRPLASVSLEKGSLVGAANIYINKDSYIALTGTAENGKPCIIEKLDQPEDGPVLKREALLCILSDKNVSPNVALMSRAFQDATGFKITDKARIYPSDAPMLDTTEVVVKDVTEKAGPLAASDLLNWAFPIGLYLERAGHVFPGMTLEGVSAAHLRRTFKVSSVDGQDSGLGRFVRSSTTIRFIQEGEEDPSAQPKDVQPPGDLVLKDIPGLKAQVPAINEFLEAFTGPFLFHDERQSCGIALHGCHGSGKTFVLKRLAGTNWGRVFWIKPADKLTTVRETLKQAQAQRPSMVLIDDLEELITPERTNRDAVIDTICDEMDSLSAEAFENNALPQVVIVATCSDYMTNMPRKLQGRSRFYEKVLIPIPRASDRLDILKGCNPPLPAEDKEACLRDISLKTHAFTAGDLYHLVRNAVKLKATKAIRAGADRHGDNASSTITREDMDQALGMTRPTAMDDINLQPPTIHWQDIGGQEEVKKALSKIIKYTKESDHPTPRIIIRPPKGLLLYGPPGCSKTLSAQAMATESGFNFFSVKAAELLNMYVGESERAVRNLFERARNATPSIIFFDEIDSIGGSRSSGPGASSRGGGGVNILTTLLTEIDGFETLTGVIILGATNRPDAMDPALLRAGRFDKAVYVGPPDLAAREAIFRVHLRGKPMADDVDLHALAVRAEGHSGAEIQHVCHDAAQDIQDRYDDDETGTAKLEFTMADLTDALEREPKAITSVMLNEYTTWMQKHMK